MSNFTIADCQVPSLFTRPDGKHHAHCSACIPWLVISCWIQSSSIIVHQSTALAIRTLQQFCISRWMYASARSHNTARELLYTCMVNHEYRIPTGIVFLSTCEIRVSWWNLYKLVIFKYIYQNLLIKCIFYCLTLVWNSIKNLHALLNESWRNCFFLFTEV